jgi:hypothetical protein
MALGPAKSLQHPAWSAGVKGLIAGLMAKRRQIAKCLFSGLHSKAQMMKGKVPQINRGLAELDILIISRLLANQFDEFPNILQTADFRC